MLFWAHFRYPQAARLVRCFLVVALCAWHSTAQAIVNGAPAMDADGMRSFVVRVENSSGEKCSGVLIAADTVMTAAHCAAGAGTYRVIGLDRRLRAETDAVAGIAIHPGFEAAAKPSRQGGIDLALLLLSHPLGAQYQPLDPIHFAPIIAGQQALVAGYGLDGAKNRALILRAAALTRLEGLRIAPGVVAFIGADSTTEAGACQGDSGGPLVGGVPGQYELLGIVSWTTPPPDEPAASCGGLTAVTPVAGEAGWIESESQRLHLASPLAPRQRRR